MAAPPPQKLDLLLEGLASFQEGAAGLKAGDPLCLQLQEGGRLACATQSGAVVGLVPADKRGLLSRGPWSGTVRSVKRHVLEVAAGSAAAAVGAGASAAEPAVGQQVQSAVLPPPTDQHQEHPEQHGGAALPQAAGQGVEGQRMEQEQRQEQMSQQQQQQQQMPTQAAAVAAQQQQVVSHVLVRFTPEEQRWAQRGQEAAMPAPEEEDAARLSTEQLHALADSDELCWMLRDERLQKVVADIDGAPDRERALLRALQAPNFKEFADKVLAVVAPEPSA